MIKEKKWSWLPSNYTNAPKDDFSLIDYKINLFLLGHYMNKRIRIVPQNT